MNGAHEMGGAMWLMMILPLVVLAVLTVAGVLIVRALWDRFGSRGSDRSAALSILEERYARGEIDQEEFATRRQHLLGTGG